MAKIKTNLLNVSLDLRVEAPLEVGQVSLLESRPAYGVGIVVEVNAASGEDSAVNASLPTAVGNVEGANGVGAHCSLFVVLTPVDIWASGAASTVEDVGGLDTL